MFAFRVLKNPNEKKNKISNIVYLLHPESFQELEGRLNTARHSASVVTYQGKIWLAGGIDENVNHLSSIEVFDPQLGIWQILGNLSNLRGDGVHLFEINDDLYAAVGFYSQGMFVEKRNHETGLWELIGNINDGQRSNCSITVLNGKIYFFGGDIFEDCKKKFSSWNSFDPLTLKWASQEEFFLEKNSRKMPPIRDATALGVPSKP